MNTRRLQTDEIEFLKDMLYEAIFVPEGRAPLSRAIIYHPSLSKYIYLWGKKRYDLAFVAEIQGKLVGAAWGRVFSEDNQGFGFLDSSTPEITIALMPEYRGRGIGTKLLQALATAYRELGIKQLSLSVQKANPALRLYQRMGFEVVEEAYDTSWTMKKELK